MGARGAWRNALLVVFVLTFPCAGADWPQFRGPNHNGISTDRVITNWTGSITNPAWRVPLTNGLCSLSVSGGKVFTQARRGLSEMCVALSATNGVELWATALDNASYPNGGVGFDDGPRSTPTYAEGSVFVLTSYLKLFRLNATNGAIIWQRDLPALYGSVVIPWQNAASPLVDNGMVYVNGNAGSASLMSFRVSDGSLAWRMHQAGMTHASPTLATIHGVRQLIFATQQGPIAVNPANGDLLWRTNYPFTYSTALCASPVVWEDVVFITGARVYFMGSVAYQVTVTNNVWSPERLWFSNATASHWMTPVCYEGFLYGPFGIFQFDGVNAQFTCLDIRRGSVKWMVPGFGRGGTVLAGNQLVCLSERGQLLLVKTATNAYSEIARFTAIPNYHSDTNKCWNMPAIADGKVFVRSSMTVAAFDLAISALKLDLPQPAALGQFQLTVGTVDGSAIGSNRAVALEILAGTNPVAPLATWARLTNSLVLTNGRVRVDNIDSTEYPQRYFISREPE
jgi:outer membrane protein assembly factor BamB